MILHDHSSERAEAYRVLADLFLEVPENEVLKTLKEDFALDSKETAEEIRKDFDSLYSYPGGRMPPLESYYCSPSERMSVAEDVAEFYVSVGLTLDEDFSLMPDHIALEFLFMSYLIEKNNTKLQKIFLEEHILNWVPYYCEELTKQAKTDFYREIVEIVRNFLNDEYELILL